MRIVFTKKKRKNFAVPKMGFVGYYAAEMGRGLEAPAKAWKVRFAAERL